VLCFTPRLAVKRPSLFPIFFVFPNSRRSSMNLLSYALAEILKSVCNRDSESISNIIVYRDVYRASRDLKGFLKDSARAASNFRVASQNEAARAADANVTRA
jgi:hypothetical protein